MGKHDWDTREFEGREELPRNAALEAPRGVDVGIWNYCVARLIEKTHKVPTYGAARAYYGNKVAKLERCFDEQERKLQGFGF